jgi:predicted S18 family serine protease
LLSFHSKCFIAALDDYAGCSDALKQYAMGGAVWPDAEIETVPDLAQVAESSAEANPVMLVNY